MNYYPYFNYAAPVAKTGLFKGLLGNIKWGSILSGTQKTLNIVNQTLPLIKQAKPILNNAKTMFRVMNEFKKIDTPIEINIEETPKLINSNNPTFFQ